MSKLYCFYSIFDQINAAFVKKNIKNPYQTFEYSVCHVCNLVIIKYFYASSISWDT